MRQDLFRTGRQQHGHRARVVRCAPETLKDEMKFTNKSVRMKKWRRRRRGEEEEVVEIGRTGLLPVFAKELNHELRGHSLYQHHPTCKPRVV